ncbi:protein of unknown function [Citrobacter amalonaticus]|uniref:Uncharacterized protein n=1 Tax=Citrobacter amalonaticus TaxID=35703 RepID=A0AAX2BIT9_CITAM|nr:protein of unknown function [Citrobacter amalonaticus]SAZ93792.1 protein of unknown function [Citrobacter amalonaticus]
MSTNVLFFILFYINALEFTFLAWKKWKGKISSQMSEFKMKKCDFYHK